MFGTEHGTPIAFSLILELNSEINIPPPEGEEGGPVARLTACRAH